MIYLKIVGCVIVFISSSLAGYSMKLKVHCRLEDLENLMSCIQIFENEVRYNINDVISSVNKVLEFAKNSNRSLFAELLERNKNDGGIPLSQIWGDCVDRISGSSCYDKEDVKVISAFGNILGSGDVTTQLKNLDIFQKNIESCIEDCRKKFTKNSPLYSRAGIYVGIVIVILLV